MRDPNRIDEVLKQIGEIWHKYPDMRLGQLIGNVLEGASLYYVEDDGLVTALKDMYEGAKEPVNYDNDAYLFDLVKAHPGEIGFVLDADTYKDYLETYETFSDDPVNDAELKENEFNALKSIFPTPAEEEPEEEVKPVPWIVRQGVDGEPKYIGLAKTEAEALAKLDPDEINENTIISKLDKDMYLSMKKDGKLNECQKMLDIIFDIETEERKEWQKGYRKQFLNTTFTFDGEFRPECEGEPSPWSCCPAKDGWFVTDPNKAMERIKALPEEELHVSVYRDGGSMSVITKDEEVFFRRKGNGKYFPYAYGRVIKNK